MIALLAAVVVGQVGVKLYGATALVDGEPEVRLRWQIPEGWIPPGGLKLYRISGTAKTLVKAIPAPTDAVVDGLLGPKFKGKKLATTAATPLPPGSKLNFTIQRGASAAAAFSALKAASLKKPSPPGVRRLTVPAASIPSRAPIRTTPTPPRVIPAPLKVRSELHLAALVDAKNAETIGLGATDRSVAAGANVSYSLVSVGAGGAETPVGSLPNFRVGADPQPPTPTGLTFLQEDDEIGLRWDRLPPASEAALLAASYRIYRSATPTDLGTRLTPKPLVIMDLDGREPLSFFVDNLNTPGTYTYRVQLVDGFGRSSALAALSVKAEEWRTPLVPRKAQAGPGVEVTKASKGRLRGEFLIPRVAGTVRPTIAWISSLAPDSMPVKYNIYRYDLDNTGQPGQKITAAPIDGAAIPFTTDDQLEDAIDLVYGPAFLDGLDQNASTLASQPARTDAEVRSRAIAVAKAKAKAAAIRRSIQATFRQSPPRQFVDATAARDHRYFYTITALYAPLGLETEEADAGEVSVPDPAKPPAVTLGAPKFTAIPPRAAPLIKVPTKASRPAFVGNQIRGRAATPRTAPPKIGAPGLKSPLLTPRFPLKLALPPDDMGGTVELSWTPLNLKGVRYRIRRRTGTEEFADIGITNPGLGSYRCAVPRSRVREYEFEVSAISRWNVIGLPAKIKTTVPATIPPDPPNLLSVTVGENDGDVVVTLEANAPEQGVSRYQILRDNAAIGFAEATAAQAGVLKFLDRGQAPGVRHTYVAIAETAAGAKSVRSAPVVGAAVKLTAAPPTALTGVAGPNGVTLRWTAAPGAASYIVRRKTSAAARPAVVGPKIVGALYTDTAAMRGRTYIYEVVAVDAAGNVSAATSVTVAVP